MELFKLMRKPPPLRRTGCFLRRGTVLYILMGTASYLVFASDASKVRKSRALTFMPYSSA